MDHKTNEADELLTPHEIAAELKVHVETVRRWIRSGHLEALSLGSAKAGYRVRREALNRFLASGRARNDAT